MKTKEILTFKKYEILVKFAWERLWIRSPDPYTFLIGWVARSKIIAPFLFDEDSDSDNDDLQSIKSYDGEHISAYDNRSLKQAENHRDPGGLEVEVDPTTTTTTANMLSNFFHAAGTFISDKIDGDKSRTRLKESETEMKILRWDIFSQTQIFFFFDCCLLSNHHTARPQY